MIESTDESPSLWTPFRIGVLVCGIILVLLLIPTFRSPEPAGSAGSNTDGNESAASLSRSQCERSLMSAIDGLQPDRLSFSSEPRVMIDTLNNWRSQCAADNTGFADQTDEHLRKQMLTPAAFERTVAERFRLRDAEHIRNSLLARSIVDRISADLRTDRERAIELFYYVVRTIDLAPPDTPNLLLTPYESLVFGVGSAADRAWTYALLLRQLRLDAVMLQPRVEGGAARWLIGVVVPGDGVLMFDPVLGLPITAEETTEAPLPEQVATLAEIRQQEGLLETYDAPNADYPLSSQDLETVDVFAIGTSSTFAPRMGRLQAEAPLSVELYDGLASNPLREQGLIQRLIAAGADGGWPSENVRVWPYPELQWNDTVEYLEDERQMIEGRFNILQGPFAITVSPDEAGNPNVNIQRPQTTLHEARIMQLLGNFGDAQKVYLRARIAVQSLQEGAPVEAQINVYTSDMATFWAAQSQYEQGDFRVAAESAISYATKQQGKFMMPAIYLASISLAKDGQLKEAIALLKDLPPDVPQYAGMQLLVERWRQQAGDSATESNSRKSAEKNATPKQPADSSQSEPSKENGADDAPADDSEATDPTEEKDAPASEKGDAEPSPVEESPAEDAPSDEVP